MANSKILAMLDREIALLRQARALLAGKSAARAHKPGESAKAAAVGAVAQPAKRAGKKKRKLSPDGRRRIAEAVKRRWEAQRKAAAGGK